MYINKLNLYAPLVMFSFHLPQASLKLVNYNNMENVMQGKADRIQFPVNGLYDQLSGSRDINYILKQIK